jgi:hypothetical protein
MLGAGIKVRGEKKKKNKKKKNSLSKLEVDVCCQHAPHALVDHGDCSQ